MTGDNYSGLWVTSQSELIRGEKKPSTLIWSSSKFRRKSSKMEIGLSVYMSRIQED